MQRGNGKCWWEVPFCEPWKERETKQRIKKNTHEKFNFNFTLYFRTISFQNSINRTM